MTEIPETAAVVVDYLKEQFEGSEVQSDPTFTAKDEIYTFSVIAQDKRYWLEVSRECLDDFPDSELARHLRATHAAEKMRSSATGTAGLTTSGIGWGLPQQT
jgi:hypothetical protein